MPEGSSNIHQEIAQIEQNLEAKKAELKERQETGEIQEMPHDKEILRETLHEKIIPDPQQTTVQDDDQTEEDQKETTLPSPKVDMPSYTQPELKERVQKLVDTAFNKSLKEASEEARQTQNPALMDAFHDALVDQLYDHLVERGKLEKL